MKFKYVMHVGVWGIQGRVSYRERGGQAGKKDPMRERGGGNSMIFPNSDFL